MDYYSNNTDWNKMKKKYIIDLENKKIYTKKDLLYARKLYNDNFKKLIKSTGTPQRSTYLKKEKSLNALTRKIYENIHAVNMGDVCRLENQVDCLQCTGFFKKIKNTKKVKIYDNKHNPRDYTKEFIYSQTSKNDCDAMSCPMSMCLMSNKNNT